MQGLRVCLQRVVLIHANNVVINESVVMLSRESFDSYILLPIPRLAVLNEGEVRLGIERVWLEQSKGNNNSVVI